MTIYGANFAPVPADNRVRFGGAESAALSVSADRTSITTRVPVNAVSGPIVVLVAGVTVEGPVFTVLDHPVPVLERLDPEYAEAASDAVIALRGSGFVTTSRVLVDGAEMPAEYRSASELRLILTPSSLPERGLHEVQVVTDAPGGGASDTRILRAVPRFAVVAAYSPRAGTVRMNFNRPPSPDAAAQVDRYVVRHRDTLAISTVLSAGRLEGAPQVVELSVEPLVAGERYVVELVALPAEDGKTTSLMKQFTAFGAPWVWEEGGSSGCGPRALSGPGAISLPGGPDFGYVVETSGHQVELLGGDYFRLEGFLGFADGVAGYHRSGTSSPPGCPGPGEERSEDGAFRAPRGAVALVPGNELWIGDTGNGRVQRWSAGEDHGFLGLVGADWTAPVVLGRVDRWVWIADGDRIRRLARDGTEAAPLEGQDGPFRFGIASGATPSAAIHTGERVVYVTDPGNHRVVRYEDGQYTGSLGAGGAGFRSGAPCCEAGTGPGEFTSPVGVALDLAGELFVIDSAEGGRLQRFDPRGSHLETIPLDFAPTGIAVTPNEEIVVSAGTRDRLHRLSPP